MHSFDFFHFRFNTDIRNLGENVKVVIRNDRERRGSGYVGQRMLNMELAYGAGRLEEKTTTTFMVLVKEDMQRVGVLE